MLSFVFLMLGIGLILWRRELAKKMNRYYSRSVNKINQQLFGGHDDLISKTMLKMSVWKEETDIKFNILFITLAGIIFIAYALAWAR